MRTRLGSGRGGGNGNGNERKELIEICKLMFLKFCYGISLIMLTLIKGFKEKETKMTARFMIWGQIKVGRLAEIDSLGEKIMRRVESSDVAVYHSELWVGIEVCSVSCFF